jgi:serine/threonine protein kinase
MADRYFLKSILPLSDELNDILRMIFEVDPCRRIKLDELRHRIINCQQFTKPQLSSPTFIDHMPYQEPLSPSSTISDEGSMISDHSDNSTVPSEIDSNEDDFSSFEVMEEDGDFSLDPAFQGPVPDASPAPKVIPKVWDAASIISVGGLQDPSLTSYVPALSSKPFDHGSSRISAEVRDIPNVCLPTPEEPEVFQPSTAVQQEAGSNLITFNTGQSRSQIHELDITLRTSPPSLVGPRGLIHGTGLLSVESINGS